MLGDLTGTTIGHYHLGRLLGRGAMGEVYLAEHTHLKSLRAVKRLNPDLAGDQDYRDNFLAEGRHAASLTHQGIASVFDTLEWDGELLLVMEYVKGHNLCEEKTPMPLKGFLDFAVDCAEALAAAHHQGIVHRDLKPANIMLAQPDNKAKILDFGVAKRLPSSVQEATTQYQHEEKQRICGTLPYMAPEALLAEDVDHRADIFSLGVVFYELITGHHPFKGGTPTATADRILHTSPPPLQKMRLNLPEELDRILRKMLAKERRDRYATSQDLAVDLTKLRRIVRGYATGDDVPTKPFVRDRDSDEPTPSHPPRPPDSRKILVAAALTVVAAFCLYWSWDWLGDRWYDWTQDLPEQQVLAVLPFQVSGGDDADRAFLLGIQKSAQVALRRLSLHYDFEVVGENLVAPALRVPGGNDPTAIVGELPVWTGATLVLTAHIRRQGSVYRTRLLLYRPDDQLREHLARRSSFELDPGDPQTLGQTLLKQAFRLIGLELPTPDARIFSQLCPQVPSAARAYFEALGLQDEGSEASLERAAHLLRTASAQDTRCGLVLAALGETYLRQHQMGSDTLASARERCGISVKLNDALVEGHLCLAEIDQIEGNVQGAVSRLRAALYNDPSNDSAMERLAGLYEWELRDPEKAAQVYGEGADRRPHYWWTRYRLGYLLSDYPQVAHRLGENPAELYDEAIRLAPYYFKAYLNAGIYYSIREEWTKAQKYFEKSIAIHPSFLAYDNLGTSYFFQRNYSAAVENYKKAIAIASENPEEQENLTYTLFANYAEALYHAPGERDNAATYFGEAIKLGEEHREEHPEDEEVYRRLAVCYTFVNQKEEALEYIERSLELKPGRKETLLKKALIMARFGQFEEAFGWVEKALKAGISAPEVRDDPSFGEMKRHDPERFDRLFEATPAGIH